MRVWKVWLTVFEVQTGDMRHMPFMAGQFDVIVSRAAIHNLYQADQREAAHCMKSCAC